MTDIDSEEAGKPDEPSSLVIMYDGCQRGHIIRQDEVYHNYSVDTGPDEEIVDVVCDYKHYRFSNEDTTGSADEERLSRLLREGEVHAVSKIQKFTVLYDNQYFSAYVDELYGTLSFLEKLDDDLQKKVFSAFKKQLYPHLVFAKTGNSSKLSPTPRSYFDA